MHKLTSTRILAASFAAMALLLAITGATAMVTLLTQARSATDLLAISQENSELFYLEYQLADIAAGITNMQLRAAANPEHAAHSHGADPAACATCEASIELFTMLPGHLESVSKQLEQISSPRLLNDWPNQFNYASIQLAKALELSRSPESSDNARRDQLAIITNHLREASGALDQPAEAESAHQLKLETDFTKSDEHRQVVLSTVIIMSICLVCVIMAVTSRQFKQTLS
jgi:hypothetical protein